jgi:signal transduction histidine kinase/CheY-like chemotaxis protein/HAMP domain-containing protein
MRGNFSLRTELILLLGALVLVATASMGSIAYRTSRSMIAADAVREVGITANARRQALVQVLTQQRARAAALIETANIGCAPEEKGCLRRLLADFLATEGATGVELQYKGRAPIVVGNGVRPPNAAVPTNQIAHFEFDQTGRPYYVTTVSAVTSDGPMAVTLRGDMRVVNQIFGDRYGLGQSGETFLTDDRGTLLTPLRHAAGQDRQESVLSTALRDCLSGNNGEILDQGYHGVPVIHGFRSIPQIGGGCAVSVIDQAEAFAPTIRLRRALLGISGSLAALAIACSLLFAQLVARPMARLSERARSLQGGDFVSPVPTGGPAEVRTFSKTFEEMARSLNTSRRDLEESTEQLRNILESISDGFIAVDRGWLCTYFNRNAASLIRRPAGGQWLGRNLWELVPFSQSARAELERGMEQRIPVHFEEFYQPREAWFAVDAYPTRVGLAIFGRDVTERRLLNERLQQTQKLESLGVLAGGIAHDFNNLLTGIIGNASMALDDLPEGAPSRTSLQGVLSAAERAAALTRQLLAYAGKGRFVIQPLDLSALVRDLSNLLETSIPKTVRLELHLGASLPAVEGDATQIQQLVMNLVINGAEAIGDHTLGTVTVTTSLQSVDQAYLQQTLMPDEVPPGTYVALEVQDTGSGMDEPTLRRIFDPFFTTKFAGRGLGLAAAMGIIRGHRGALKVHSAPGKGSHFTVLFPAYSGEAPHAPTPVAADSRAGRGTVLVIDDEEIVRRTARSILEHLGYSVILAEDGRQGVEVFRKLGGRVALVVLDLTMPAMSGEQTLEQLKAIRADVPVILSSGYDQVDATRRFTGKPLAGFLQKPFTAVQLARQVRLAMEPSGQSREVSPSYLRND